MARAILLSLDKMMARAIPLSLDKMMDYQLDKVTRDRVSTFATISSLLSMIHAAPLPNLGASSLQFKKASGGDLTASTSVDRQQL